MEFGIETSHQFCMRRDFDVAEDQIFPKSDTQSTSDVQNHTE